MTQLEMGIGKLLRYMVKHLQTFLLLTALALIAYQQFELNRMEERQDKIAANTQEAVNFLKGNGHTYSFKRVSLSNGSQDRLDNIQSTLYDIQSTAEDIQGTVDDMKLIVDDIQSTVDNIAANQ